MSATHPTDVFVASGSIEPAPWQSAAGADWVPLHAGLREVHASPLSAAQVQQQTEQEAAEAQVQHAAGYDAGYRSGTQAAEQELAQWRERAAAQLRLLGTWRQDALRSSQEQLVRLSLHIAGQVLLADLGARQDFVRRMVERGLDLLRQADRVEVHLAPDDLAWLQARHPDLLRVPGVEAVPDRSLLLGGARLESELGVVDASIESRLADMASQIHLQQDAQSLPLGTPPAQGAP